MVPNLSCWKGLVLHFQFCVSVSLSHLSIGFGNTNPSSASLLPLKTTSCGSHKNMVSLVPKETTMSPSFIRVPASEEGLSPVAATTAQSEENPYFDENNGEILPRTSSELQGGFGREFEGEVE